MAGLIDLRKRKRVMEKRRSQLRYYVEGLEESIMMYGLFALRYDNCDITLNFSRNKSLLTAGCHIIIMDGCRRSYLVRNNKTKTQKLFFFEPVYSSSESVHLSNL
jgi:hypothetical protein